MVRESCQAEFGDMPVDAVAGAHVMDVLLPIWFTTADFEDFGVL